MAGGIYNEKDYLKLVEENFANLPKNKPLVLEDVDFKPNKCFLPRKEYEKAYFSDTDM